MAIFGAGLGIFAVLRVRTAGDVIEIEVVPSSSTNNAPQTIQTVERPIVLFRPPAAKPPPTAPAKPIERPTPRLEPSTPTNAAALAPVVATPVAPTLPIALFADTGAGIPEPKVPGPFFAPYGRLIPCETIITVDSAASQAPIIGLVTENIYHAGHLIIPAGTEIHGTSRPDRNRERIASGTAWTLVWTTGEELRLKGVALDREFSSGQEGWGVTDGSAGLGGRLIKSDSLEEIKLFAATLLSGAASALTEKESTLFGSIDSRSLNNAPLKGAQDVLKIYSQRILEAIGRDGYYVRVPSGKQFYLYVLQTLDRAEASIGGTGKPFEVEGWAEPSPAHAVAAPAKPENSPSTPHP